MCIRDRPGTAAHPRSLKVVRGPGTLKPTLANTTAKYLN